MLGLRRIAGAFVVLAAVDSSGQTADPNLAPIEAAIEKIQKNYIRKIPREQLIAAAIRGMAESLDPYSTYMTAAEYGEFKARTAAEFGGIGIAMHMDPDAHRVAVRHLLHDGPAQGTGIRRGDLLIEIDGKSTEGLSLDELFPRLRGTAGSTVRVVVRQKDSDVLRKYELKRAVIKTPTVRGARRRVDGSWDYLHDRDRRIGYIRITSMGDDTLGRVESALTELKAHGMKSLILDLRGNIGGKFKTATGIADLFLDRGPMIIETLPDETKTTEATPGVMTDVPVAMLIDERTASAGEVLAAALADSGRVVAIGTRTFGKGYLQRLYELGEEMGALTLTTSAYAGPSAKNFDTHYAKHLAEKAGAQKLEEVKGGVAPNAGMEILLTKEEYEAWSEDANLLDGSLILVDSDLKNPPDRVLDRAIEVLTAKEKSHESRE